MRSRIQKEKNINNNYSIINKEQSQRYKRMKTFKECSPLKSKSNLYHNNEKNKQKHINKRNKYFDNKLFELIKKNSYTHKSNNNVNNNNILCIKSKNKNKIISRNNNEFKKNFKDNINKSKKNYSGNMTSSNTNNKNINLNKRFNYNFTVNFLKISRNDITNKNRIKFKKK